MELLWKLHALIYRNGIALWLQCWPPSSLALISSNKGFPGSLVGKESACNAGDPSLITGLGSSPGKGIGYPLQYLSWSIPMDGGAWRAAVHRVAKR